jgi:exosome complex component RRP41
MPLDTSTYTLALLRLDGRRWNELRRIHGQVSTQAAADGSSYLEMGNTKVICTVSGPGELRRSAAGQASGVGSGSGGGGGAGAGVGNTDENVANVVVEVSVAGFSAVDRKRRGGGDK